MTGPPDSGEPSARVLVAEDGVEAFELDGRHALFHEGLQQLVELNETAHAIWLGVSAGGTRDELILELRGRGADDDQAARFVDEAVAEWSGAGWLRLVDAAPQADPGAFARWRLSILDTGFEVVLRAPVQPAGLDQLLGPLQGEGPIGSRIEVSAWRDGFRLTVDKGRWRFFAHNAIVPAVKAALVERLSASVTQGFLAHGALMEGDAGRLFLSGPPGAGKSTLAAALREQGWRCRSDDIVHIDPEGGARGVPFPLTLKSSAWPILPSLAAVLEALPVHRRGDGQSVRYLPEVSPGDARPLDGFVVLRRLAGAPASIEPLSSLEAMRRLLEDAFSVDRRISAAQVKALALAFGRTRCFSLRYDDLSQAAATLVRFRDE